MGDTPAGYEIIEYRPELRDQVLQLQTFMWSPDVRTNAAYFDWKYINNPCRDKPIIYLAMHAGQVVGMRGMFGMNWEGGQGGETFCCLQDADAVVHPDHRRRRLYETLTTVTLEEARRRGFEVVIALSSNPTSVPTFIKLGWRSVAAAQAVERHARREEDSSLRKLVRQLPLLPSVYRRLRGAASDLAVAAPGQYAPYEAFDRRSASGRSRPSGQLCVENAPRPEAMAALVDRLGHDRRLRQIRAQEFFAWRFQNPLSEYRFLFLGEADLEGYLVLHMSARPGEARWCTLVDWEAASNSARRELLQAVIDWGDFDNLVVWSAALPDETKSLLRECGFDLSPAAESNSANTFCPRLLTRLIRQEADELNWSFAGQQLLDPSSWDLRAIYSDDF